MKNTHSHHTGHSHHEHASRADHEPHRHFAGGPGRFPGGPEGFGPGPGFGSGFGAAFGAGFGPGGRGGRGGFGPGFGPRGPKRAGRGDVRSAILSLLADGPSNGYGLIKTIAERTSGVWTPSPGSVYPTLAQLVDEDLIAAKGDGRRTAFELTDAGRSYVAEHADELTKAWEATPGRSEADAAFRESAEKLFGVVAQFRQGVTEAQRTAAIEKLDEARRALYLILAD